MRATETVALQSHISQGHAKEVFTADIHTQLALDLARAAIHGHIKHMLAHGHHVLGNKLAFHVHGVALTVDVKRGAFGDVAALNTDSGAIERNVLQTQTIAGKGTVDQALLERLLQGQRAVHGLFQVVTQQGVGTLLVFGRDQLEFAGVGFVELNALAFPIGLAIGPHDVDELITHTVAVVARQLAIPFGGDNRPHLEGHGGHGLHKVGVAGPEDQQLHALDEVRVVAAYVEVDGLGDATHVQRHQGGTGSGQLSLTQCRVFGGPDHAAIGQREGEAPAYIGLARGFEPDGDTAIRCQLLRVGLAASALGQRLVVALRVQTEQHLAIGITLTRLACSAYSAYVSCFCLRSISRCSSGGCTRRRRCCGLGSPDSSRRSRHQTHDGVVKQFHFHDREPQWDAALGTGRRAKALSASAWT